MCSSMRALSVRGTLLLPILVWPLFRISSRTDFKLGNLLEGFTSVHSDPEWKPRWNPGHSAAARMTHPHATYGSTIFIISMEVLFILMKVPLKIFLSLIIWITFITLGLTPLILTGHNSRDLIEGIKGCSIGFQIIKTSLSTVTVQINRQLLYFWRS